MITTGIMVLSETASAPTVAQALQDVGSVFSNAVNMISGQPLALVFVGIAVAGAGLGLFHRVIRH